MTDTPPPKSFGLLFQMAGNRVAATLLMLLVDLLNTLILRNENHDGQVEEKRLCLYSLNKKNGCPALR